jgi:hypothetical protein
MRFLAILAILVAVDPRIELLAILFRLAGSPEYVRAEGPYAAAVDARFASFRDHPAVQMSRELRRRHGIGYDALPRLAVQLDPGFHLAGSLPERWTATPVDAYLEAVRDFAARSDFRAFARAQAGYTAAVEERFRAFLGDKPIVDWFDGAFGRRAGTSYRLVPGLLTGPMSYGVAAKGAIVEVIHLEAPDADGLPRPGELTHGLLAHELAHSYVNPVVEAARWDTAAPAYERVHDAMARQVYTTLPIFVDECVVRAVTALYLGDRAGVEAARRSVAEDERLSFRWTRDLAAALDAVRKRHGGRIPDAELVETARRILR